MRSWMTEVNTGTIKGNLLPNMKLKKKKPH